MVISFYFLFLHWLLVVDGLPQAFALRNDEGVKGNDFFLFSVFFVVVLWFVDCHRPLAFAMTKGARGGIHKLVIARVACNSWQSQYGVLWQSNKTRHCENRRFVAISVWGIILFIHGILFLFCFFCGGFVVCGLPRLLRSLAMTKSDE